MLLIKETLETNKDKVKLQRLEFPELTYLEKREL